MKILALNGSPKGEYSVTLQTLEYIKALHPEHEFSVLHAAKNIRAFERDFAEAEAALKGADVILFVYPVYTFLIPSQLQRFIELMKEREGIAAGKYCSQITTSKHFYDITAHAYIEENCLDMRMRYIEGLSADMEDLLTKKGRRDAEDWFSRLVFRIENNIVKEPASRRRAAPLRGAIPAPASFGGKLEKGKEFDVVLVHNAAKDDTRLRLMIDDFKALFRYPVREENIREFPFKGGCLGCFSCAADGKCVYTDGFDEYLRRKIQNADAIVYAFTIENHWAHSSFKMFDDRQFCNGHRTVTSGKPVAYLLSGPYSEERNVQTVIEARCEVGGNFNAGVASDEGDVKGDIEKLSKMLAYALENKCRSPKNFYGVGGTKIFRDLIYEMRGLMKADHRYYKTHGIYDFPQSKKKTILMMKAVGALMSVPAVKNRMKGLLLKYMLVPYRRVIDSLSGGKNKP